VAVELNHTIVAARDPEASAAFVSEILGLAAPRALRAVHDGGDRERREPRLPREGRRDHEPALRLPGRRGRFDEIFGRIQAEGISYWADPYKTRPAEINRNDGGRGVYFEDPDGHLLEILTRPYGSGNARE